MLDVVLDVLCVLCDNMLCENMLCENMLCENMLCEIKCVA